MDEETRRKVVRAALSVHGKKLDDSQMDMVVQKPETGNPLFLRTVLDEARFFGNFFMLTQCVCECVFVRGRPTVGRSGQGMIRGGRACSCGRACVCVLFVWRREARVSHFCMRRCPPARTHVSAKNLPTPE